MTKSIREEQVGAVALQSFRFIMPDPNDPMVVETEDLRRKAMKVTIKNDKGKVVVNDWLLQVKQLLAKSKENKDLILKPVKETLLNPITDYFKRIDTPLLEAEKMFKSALAIYSIQQDKDRVELADLLKEEGGSGLAVVLAPETKIEGDEGKTTISTVMTFEITDIRKVPEEVVRSAVETKRGREGLEQVIRSLVDGGTRKMAGVKIEEGRRVSVTLR